ncbi:hypothetical protein CVT24_012087, partial [Panaeolus cyanescens]
MPKPSKRKLSNPFLDVEAEVDNNESSDEENQGRESDEDFIDNDLEFEYEPSPPSEAALNRQPSPCPSATSVANTTSRLDFEDEEGLDSDLEDMLEDIAGDLLGVPYWRLACKAGLEKDVVEFLDKAAERYKLVIRSTFHPTLRTGWIYLQATITKRLHRVLLSTRGVLRRGNEVLIRTSTPEEFLGVLRSDEINVKHSVNEYQWVRVVRGIYKGDPAIAIAMGGELVDVVVIPRINQTRKRKAPGVRISPALFNAVEFQQTYPSKIVRSHGEQLYSAGACEFEFGLHRLSVAWEAVDPTQICLPTHILDLFQRSGHPAVKRALHIPKPLEWCMSVGDKVFIPHKNQMGLISSVEITQVYVDVGEAGIIPTRWNALRKAISVGNFVEIGAGPCKEALGWVVSQVGPSCVVLQSKEGTNEIEEIPVHINWLKPTTPPVNHPKPTRVLNSVVKDYMPWRNARIIITKQKDANKGK